MDRGCRWCQALPGEWCESDCGAPTAVIHPTYRKRSPLAGLWSKRNTPSGHFEAIKRSGDVTKGVKREN